MVVKKLHFFNEKKYKERNKFLQIVLKRGAIQKKLVTRLPNFPDRRIRYEFFFKNIVTNKKINF